MSNIKFKSLLSKFTFMNILQWKKLKKNFVISLQLPKNKSHNLRKDHWIARKLRGILRNARDSRTARKTLNCEDCAGFAQPRNSRISDILFWMHLISKHRQFVNIFDFDRNTQVQICLICISRSICIQAYARSVTDALMRWIPHLLADSVGDISRFLVFLPHFMYYLCNFIWSMFIWYISWRVLLIIWPKTCIFMPRLT